MKWKEKMQIIFILRIKENYGRKKAQSLNKHFIFYDSSVDIQNITRQQYTETKNHHRHKNKDNTLPLK